MFVLSPLYTVDSVRRIDAIAIARDGDEGYALMQKAAAFAYQSLRERLPKMRSITVLAGPGNNGGDALVLARLAQVDGLVVRTFLLGDQPELLQGAAARAWDDFLAAGLELFDGELIPADAVIDGLFGTGLKRALKQQAAEWVQWINAQRGRSTVLALDIPSGLDADTGLASGPHVEADLTCSFVGRKFGHDLGEAINASGALHFDNLGVSPLASVSQSQHEIRPVAQRVEQVLWERRPVSAHKGNAGHVLLLGGLPRYAGATVLAAHAALRAGCGKLTVLDDAPAAHPALWPEVMRASARNKNEVIGLAADVDALCVGPGLGRDEGQLARLQLLRRSTRPQVWDADALWALGRWPDLMPARAVLTPHPGEAASMLETSVAAVQADRAGALQQLVKKWESVVVLKGARTLVGAPERLPVVVPQGHPGMGVGGMGDALAGIIAALLAQGHDVFDAAVAGAWLLGSTADALWVQRGYSLLPHDVIDALRVGPV